MISPPNKPLSFREQMLLRASVGGDSFASTQRYLTILDVNNQKEKKRKLDRTASGLEVDRLIKLREQMIQDAHARNDNEEVRRLESLGVFDSVCAPSPVSTTKKGNGDAATESRGSNPPQYGPKDGRDRLERHSPLPCPPEEKPPAPPPSKSADRIPHRSHTNPSTFLTLALTSSTASAFPPLQMVHRHRTPSGTPIPPATKTAHKRIVQLVNSPLIKRLMDDLKMLQEAEAGMYAPGAPEMEMIRRRVERAMGSARVEELEGLLGVMGAWEEKERKREKAKEGGKGKGKIEEEEHPLMRVKGEGGKKGGEKGGRKGDGRHVVWWDSCGMSIPAKQRVQGSKFCEML